MLNGCKCRFSLESALFFFFFFKEWCSKAHWYKTQHICVPCSCIVLISMFCVFNASIGKWDLSSTKIYTGLHVTRIRPKCALKCIKNVYIHISMQYSKSTHNDSPANWKIISKLFLLNYPCLSGRFNKREIKIYLQLLLDCYRLKQYLDLRNRTISLVFYALFILL